MHRVDRRLPSYCTSAQALSATPSRHLKLFTSRAGSVPALPQRFGRVRLSSAAGRRGPIRTHTRIPCVQRRTPPHRRLCRLLLLVSRAIVAACKVWPRPSNERLPMPILPPFKALRPLTRLLRDPFFALGQISGADASRVVHTRTQPYMYSMYIPPRHPMGGRGVACFAARCVFGCSATSSRQSRPIAGVSRHDLSQTHCFVERCSRQLDDVDQ